MPMSRKSLRRLTPAVILLLLSPLAALSAEGPGANPLALLKSANYAALERYYPEQQKRYESGALSDGDLYGSFRALYEDSAANEQYFSAWVRAYPKSYSARMARGTYYYRMAWFVRGEKYIRETPPEQIDRMRQYLEKATDDLQASVEMTEKPYLSALYLLNVGMLSGSQETRRSVLDFANKIDPRNVLVRRRYMFSLKPRWGGSWEEMRAFLEECRRERLPERQLATLEMEIILDIADVRSQEATASERYNMWSEILRLEKRAGQANSAEAVMRQTRAAWDLNRRDEARRGLEQLATMQVDAPWVLSQIGWMYAQLNRHEDAWPYLLKAADLNDAWAQFAVGKTIYLGAPNLNVAADRNAGLAWIRRAADQDFEEARAFLSSAAK